MWLWIYSPASIETVHLMDLDHSLYCISAWNNCLQLGVACTVRGMVRVIVVVVMLAAVCVVLAKAGPLLLLLVGRWAQCCHPPLSLPLPHSLSISPSFPLSLLLPFCFISFLSPFFSVSPSFSLFPPLSLSLFLPISGCCISCMS